MRSEVGKETRGWIVQALGRYLAFTLSEMEPPEGFE